MKRLFVDMDGTLARVYANKAYLELIYQPGYFASLKPYRKVVDAMKRFQKLHPEVEVFVLSACCVDTAEAEKNKWLDSYFPVDRNKRVFMEAGQNKARFVPNGITAEDYLMDDYTKNLLQWVEAGGSGIKIRNEINCQNGHWKGNRVSSYDSSARIVEDLENILGLN